MGLFKDERKFGKLADAAADLNEEGGSRRARKAKGSAYEPATVKSTSLGNLRDALKTFREGR